MLASDGGAAAMVSRSARVVVASASRTPAVAANTAHRVSSASAM